MFLTIKDNVSVIIWKLSLYSQILVKTGMYYEERFVIVQHNVSTLFRYICNSNGDLRSVFYLIVPMINI